MSVKHNKIVSGLSLFVHWNQQKFSCSLEVGLEYIYFIGINIYKTPHLYLGMDTVFLVQKKANAKRGGILQSKYPCMHKSWYLFCSYKSRVIQYISEREARICSVLHWFFVYVCLKPHIKGSTSLLAPADPNGVNEFVSVHIRSEFGYHSQLLLGSWQCI